MLLLKLLQSLFKALNSEGTPGQVGAGMALGMVFGLTPLVSLHNLAFLGIAMLTTVSFPGVMLGWAIAVPLGFLLDPAFDAVGHALLTAGALTGLWTWVVNTPVLALFRLNNTIVLGSLVVWLAAFGPLFVLYRWLVARYRATVYARLEKTRVFKAVKASKVWNLYQLLRP